MTPERRTYTLNNAKPVVSLDTISSFHLIDYQGFWDGSCHSVAMVKMQLTKVICSEILIKDWLIMFIAGSLRRQVRASNQPRFTG